MKKISLCIIVKNEEKVLERCLNGIKDVVDEIIIVDTGSTDNTKQIAKMFTDKVYDFEWCDDFSKARNYSFSKATKDYIMWLDADDVVEKSEADKILKLKNTIDDDVACAYMVYQIAFDEQNNPTFFYNRERLFKAKAKPVWQEPLHEYVLCAGKTIKTDIVIKHKKINQGNPKRNLEIYNKMKENKILFSNRMQYYYARELMYNSQYKKAITEFKKFLNSPYGWSQNKVEACIEMANCFTALKQNQKALESLFQSFVYHKPTGEALCKIAEIFKTSKNIDMAIYWYNLALTSATKLSGGFVQEDYYNFIPALNLCLLYYEKKDLEKAIQYNSIAGIFKPNNPAFLHNKKFFDSIKKKDKAILKLTENKYNKYYPKNKNVKH
jgi:glycosyltransferase involved in cell wall biosynthesis